jgi:glycosyltransferase involved in cell wall biosynthesis
LIRVLYTITALDPGGAENGLVRIVNKLAAHPEYCVEVAVLRSDRTQLRATIEDEVPVKTVGLHSLRDMGRLSRLIEHMRRFKPDYIISSLFHATVVSRLLKPFFPGTKLLSWQHNSHFGGSVRERINRLSCGLSDVILADCRSTAEEVHIRLGMPRSRIRVLPLASPVLEELDGSMQQSPPKNWDGGGAVIIGSTGRLTKEKGYSCLLRAFEQLLYHSYDKPLKLRIAGSGELLGELERQAALLGIENNVEFLGYVDDIPSFLSTLDIYVQPSLTEGRCLSVVEARAAGLPIVASRVGGIPETVDDGLNGVLVPPGDSKALSGALQTLVDDHRLRGKLAATGLRMARAEEADMLSGLQELLVAGRR